MFKVTMVDGNYTKDLWVYNEVKEGDKVKDKTGEVFKVTNVIKIAAAAIQGTELEVLNG